MLKRVFTDVCDIITLGAELGLMAAGTATLVGKGDVVKEGWDNLSDTTKLAIGGTVAVASTVSLAKNVNNYLAVKKFESQINDTISNINKEFEEAMKK